MVYSTQANKWRAYQFLDPFAAGAFVACNKNNNVFCRPDCDFHPNLELQHEVKFLDTAAEAVDLGFSPCGACDPMSAPKIDVNVLAEAVDAINTSIGFFPPSRNEDDSSHTESNSPSTKDEADHYRLVDLACRHLVMAAAQSVLTSDSPDAYGKKSRRRRGGVLGFKELAAKSKLSAWHFHRVFKNVTCLTPKTYGSKCVEYLTQHRNKSQAQSPLSSTSNSSVSLKSYATPILSATSVSLPRKRSIDELDEQIEMSNKKPSFDTIFTPNASPLVVGYEKGLSLELPEMLWVAPQANAYTPAPETLFTHVKPAMDRITPEITSFDELAPQMLPMGIEPMVPATDNYLDNLDNSFFQAFPEVGEEQVMWQHEPVLTDPYIWNMPLEVLTPNLV